ncbi:hypothetical protein D3C71_1512560 [compost metagenome]
MRGQNRAVIIEREGRRLRDGKIDTLAALVREGRVLGIDISAVLIDGQRLAVAKISSFTGCKFRRSGDFGAEGADAAFRAGIGAIEDRTGNHVVGAVLSCGRRLAESGRTGFGCSAEGRPPAG